MGEEGAQTLYTTDDTGNYVEYTQPEPAAFHDTLPEDLKASEHLEGVEDAAGLARYYVDLKSTQLKPPDTADGYEFEKPEGYMVTDDELSGFKNLAFENDINQKQFSALMDSFAANQKRSSETYETNVTNARAESETELKTQWGDKYEENLESAKRLLNHADAPAKFKPFLEASKFGDAAPVIEWVSWIAKGISEDTFTKPGIGNDEPKRPVGEDGRPMLSFPSMT